ncbi:uncharacterized protein [Medicago truncatula]|uniref:HNH endonuclease domain protein n=1 Tax=Medicago truncatula TaxID=3880 RepID=A0A072URJ3_MEDTR|nr:uncharacterized protein LOC25493851 isoform X2 [Medicago truncatula]KEH31971.1 HNH endonuclease domain protein [Medicago truncatula]
MSLELKKQSESKIDNNGKGVMARGSSEKREFKHKEKSRSKSESRECFVCKKEGHFKKNCPERKKFMKDKYNDEDSGGESTADNCQILQSRVNRLKSDKSQIDSDKLRGYSCDINFTDKELDIIEMAVYGDVIRPGNQCRCRTVDEVLGKFKAKDDTNACKLP